MKYDTPTKTGKPYTSPITHGRRHNSNIQNKSNIYVLINQLIKPDKILLGCTILCLPSYQAQQSGKLTTIFNSCTVNSKINGTPKGVYLPISKLHSIYAIVNSLAHNNLWLCYHGQLGK